MNSETGIEIKKHIARQLVNDAAQMGFVVSVYDRHGRYLLKKSANVNEIMAVFIKTDLDDLILRLRKMISESIKKG